MARNPPDLARVSEAERLEAVKLAVELGHGVIARTTLGDYPMIGTVEAMLLRYPDNIQDLLGLGVGDPRFNQGADASRALPCIRSGCGAP